MDNKITIIGTGYVGLVTGACLSDFGLEVICIDNDGEKIRKLNKCEIPIYEPGLEQIIKKNFDAGRLKFSTDIKLGIQNADVIFIAVGTPPKEDGSADLKYVEEVALSIAKHMDAYKVIVNKSTVPIGTGKYLIDLINKNQITKIDFDIVSNPEFLREGAAVKDCMHPDRIVIGAQSEKAINVMRNVYRVLYLNEVPFVITNIESAEMIKYASNAFLAVKITFINEIANLCEKVGANVKDVAIAMGKDGRIGSKFLHPGPGYGGSCFPKDTSALAYTANMVGSPLTVIEATITANEKQKLKMVEKIYTNFPDIKGLTFGVLGLAFKPETDDMRDAPSITIINELIARGAFIKAYDPKSNDEAKKVFQKNNNIIFCADEYETVDGVDAVILITEWNQFRSLHLERIKNNMKQKYFFDLRNVYDKEDMLSIGFKYISVGR